MASTIDRAWKAYHSGELETAHSAFSELTDQDKPAPHSLIQYGLFNLRIDEFESAIKNFGQATTIAPDNPAAHFFLAVAQELGDSLEESKATLDKLRSLEPLHQGISSLELLQALRHGNPLTSLQEFGFGPQKTQEPVSILKRLSAGLGSGEPDWLPSDLSSSDYLLGPILVEIECRLHPLEIPTLEHQATFFPDGIDEVTVDRRTYREEVQQLWPSIRAGSSLRKGKGSLEKAFGLEDRVRQKQLLTAALQQLRLSRKIDPFGFRVSYHLGETYLFLARGKPGEPYSKFRLLQAQSAFLESARKEGINPYLLFYLAYTQHLLGRPKLAIEYYEEATKKFEKLPEAHFGRGQCWLLLGEKRKAKELLLKAVNSDLTLARERMDTFANLMAEHGPDHFPTELPKLPELVESSKDDDSSDIEKNETEVEQEPVEDAAEVEPTPED